MQSLYFAAGSLITAVDLAAAKHPAAADPVADTDLVAAMAADLAAAGLAALI